MEIRIRSWCCGLQKFVLILGILQTVIYILGALGIIIWYLLQNYRYKEELFQTVVEISNLADVFPASDQTNLILLISGLVTAFLGVGSSLFLVVGAKTRQRCLLLPWLILHFCLVALILVAGLYLIINYTILEEEKDYVKAALSLFLIVFGILFIFVWILVDQLFIRQKTEKPAVAESAARWASMQSIKSYSEPQYLDTQTIRSVRSLARETITKSESVAGTLRVRDGGSKFIKQDFYSGVNLANLSKQNKSRSMEHILASSSNNSLSSKESNQFKSLPRLSKANLKKRRTNSFLENSANTDTLRSCKSVGSSKSVTIDPQVREYRYQKFATLETRTMSWDRPNPSLDNATWEPELNQEICSRISDGGPISSTVIGHSSSILGSRRSEGLLKEGLTSPPYLCSMPQYPPVFYEEAVTEFRSSPYPSDLVQKRGRYQDVASDVPSPVYPRGKGEARTEGWSLESKEEPRQERIEQLRQERIEQPRQERIEQPRQERIEQPRQERIEQPCQDRIEQPRQEMIEQHRQERIEQPRQERIEQPRQERIEQPRQERIEQHREGRSEERRLPREGFLVRPRGLTREEIINRYCDVQL